RAFDCLCLGLRPALGAARISGLERLCAALVADGSLGRGRAMRLHTRTWGDPAATRNAVLIHGVTSNAASWVRVGPELAAWGFYVVAPDLRGHGDSPKVDRQYALDLMAADLADSVPAAPTLLVGHSFGGVMAILATLRGILKPSAIVLED